MSCSVHWPWKDTLISQTFSPSLFRGVVWNWLILLVSRKQLVYWGDFSAALQLVQWEYLLQVVLYLLWKGCYEVLILAICMWSYLKSAVYLKDFCRHAHMCTHTQTCMCVCAPGGEGGRGGAVLPHAKKGLGRVKLDSPGQGPPLEAS